MAPPLLALFPGSLFFPALFFFCRAALRSVPGCREPRAAILAARLVSAVQAVLASLSGFIIASSCRNVIDDTHWLAAAYPPFAAPYFIYDLFAMYLCHRRRRLLKGHEEDEEENSGSAAIAFLRRELLMVLHHLAMVGVCFPIATLWRQGKGDFFLGCLLMAELSTPFVCLGKVLIMFGLQHSALHRLNGAAALLTFFACRVLLFPYLYWSYGRHLGVPLLRVPSLLPPSYNLAAAALLAPQLYWFGLLCRGAWRLWRNQPPRPP